jgi:hypothetical protein
LEAEFNMAVPDSILKLCETFARHREHYKSGGYNETELRREFLDPFFKALGWDVDNEQGYADAYKDVIHEDFIKIGGLTKAPDYCFRIGGNRKFFVEAKKPSVNIHADVAPAYQLRRYGWSAKLPLSVLSDFEELSVYDTRVRPSKNDKSSKARILYFNCEDYAEKWDEIAAVFSREAVLKGSFDKYADITKKKHGTGEVDDAFLEEIERWRDGLARNLALRNPSLSVRDLNFAVQKTIDRIIFLRICEDRGTEDYGRLQTLCNGGRTYIRLMEQFRQADDRYNSGLFHFDNGEKGRAEAPDALTPGLTLDDAALKDILKNLYYPDSPYEFSVLPADILGQVYEQFLGKTISLTAAHQAKVEEKPEVRKAGGVYYTPGYIVDYIIKNTLGRLLDGDDSENPQPVALTKAAEIKVLDPACGSGSFLIAAYQYLLDWHLRQYTADPATGTPDGGKIKRYAGGKEPRIYQASGGVWKLTTAERKRILLNNIHGVDIDSQAVEVTKLSLLLKVLEGETRQQLQRDFIRERQRILPDLGNNIRCGNSLIGPEAYDHRQFSLLPEEDGYRINVFDWKQAFPKIMQAGGFDAIIGNPPYIRIQVMKEWAPVEVDLYKELYRAAAAGNYDIYVVFAEKALKLLNKSGRMGFILPHKFFNAQYGAALRGIIAEGKHLARVVHFGDQQVFPGATTYTCLLFLDKAGANECHFTKVHDLAAWKLSILAVGADEEVSPVPVVNEAAAIYRVRRSKKNSMLTEGTIPAKLIKGEEWNFAVGPGARSLECLNRIQTKLGDVAHIFQGLVTGADKIFILPTDVAIERGLTKPFLLTGNLTAYDTPSQSARILFPYEIKNRKAELIPADVLKQRFPKGWAYLCERRKELMSRERGKWHHDRWYAFGRAQNLTQMDAAKLIVQVTAQRPTVLLDENGLYMTGGGSGPFYGIRPKDSSLPTKYLLAILNSALFGTIIKAQSTNLRGGYIKFSKQYIETAPIVLPEEAGSEKVKTLVALVDGIIRLRQQLATAKSPHDKEATERQVHAATRQMDQLVYKLYGFTDEEIALVEASSK